MTRAEHLAWAKQRALEYLPSEPVTAISSMLSDLNEHRDLQNHPGMVMSPMAYGRHNDPAEVRNWIKGFN
jgi:hypothetical protein